MALLTALRVLPRFAQRLGLWLVQPIRGGWLARIAAVLRQSGFQFRDLCLKCSHLCRQIANQRTQGPQLANQFIFLGNAQSGKVGKFVHANLKARGVPCA